MPVLSITQTLNMAAQYGSPSLIQLRRRGAQHADQDFCFIQFHVQGGHYLSEDPAYFDGAFFNITRNELLALDPQQRLVMENVYHALENAGIPMANVVGSDTSVFVSGFNHDYLGILNSDPETAIKYKPIGVANAILSNRVSWFFDFKGPSMTVDTACSSSLVALHLAVQSLRSRESNMVRDKPVDDFVNNMFTLCCY